MAIESVETTYTASDESNATVAHELLISREPIALEQGALDL
jgi:hypothetical protein